jgi:hypothetical protein
MESSSLRFDAAGSELFRAVTLARARLALIEARHDQLYREGSPEVRDAGLEYASAVHDYSNLVMKWLIWIDRHGTSAKTSAESSANSATEP